LVNADDSFEKTSELTVDDFSKFNEDDIRSLVEGIVKASNLPALSGGEPLEDLGSLLFDEFADQIKRLRETNEKMSERMKSTLNSAFGSISHGAMKSLVESMSSLNLARSSLQLSPAVESYRKFHEDHERLLGGLNRSTFSNVSAFEASKPPIHELLTPNISDTPMGRAANASEESAAQLREVAGMVGNMADKLANLHTVFLIEVLPQWGNSLKENSKAMNTTLEQAETNLVWAKWALIISVIMTTLMTGWQIWIASDYKLDNDKQQSVSLSIMEEQLKASKDLNKQLIINSIQLKEDLSKLQQSVEGLKASKYEASKQINK